MSVENTERPPHVPVPVLLAAFALSGAAALAYEVIWTRRLSLVLGSTTYAVSTMLATFMLGLAIGGVLGGRVADRSREPATWLGGVELGIGILGIGSHAVLSVLPSVYLAAYKASHASAALFFAVQVGLAALVMLPPTILMGATFPLAMRSASIRVERLGQTIGVLYGANTLGAVLGSLSAGFLLVPSLGLRGATFAAAAANAGVAALLVFGRPTARGRNTLLLVLLYLPAGAVATYLDREAPLVNFYSANRFLGVDAAAADRELAHLVRLFDHEGPDGHVSAFRGPEGHLLLQVGGKIEGTGALDLPNALALAYLPVASHREARRVLVIGLGAGVTLEAARRIAPEVELAEISPGVLEAVRLHGPPGVLERLPIHLNDARNVLLRSDRRWDVITSEPSYPTDFAVANLFTREFYQLAADRLADGGIFCMWLPYYMLANDDVTMMVKTFASVFPHASLWKLPRSIDLLMIGSMRPFAYDTDQILARTTSLAGQPLAMTLSRGPEEVAKIAARPDVPINTDDRPLLEFLIARNLRVADLSTLDR